MKLVFFTKEKSLRNLDIAIFEVLVAEKGKKWYIIPWDENVEILNGLSLNIGKELSNKL